MNELQADLTRYAKKGHYYADKQLIDPKTIAS
jgi:hypothetical protein